MTITATYAGDLSRVRLAFSGAPAAADSAILERSSNQITWTQVRGGAAVPVTAGAGSLDDYEFTPGTTNYYRVSYVDAGPITYVGKGTAVTGNNASLTPTLPTGLVVGDLMLLAASIRDSGTGTVNTPTGWTAVNVSGNVGLFARRYQSGDTAPTVTFSGGISNADTLANIAAWRNASAVPLVAQSLLNASAQNMNTPSMAISEDNTLSVFIGWKQDDWTSVGDVLSEIQEIVSVAGDDAAMVWNYLVQTTATNWNTGAYTVTGGAAAISRVLSTAFPPAPWISQETVSVVPEIDRVWFKRPDAPYLNTSVSDPVGLLSIGRKSRGSTFDVIGRVAPIAVTDVRSASTYTIGVRIADPDEADGIELILSAGSPVLMQYPPGIRIKDSYVLIGDSDYDDETSTYTLPMTEVAAIDPSIVGATTTWSNVIATWATWADLLAAESTWATLLDQIGDPADVITE